MCQNIAALPKAYFYPQSITSSIPTLLMSYVSTCVSIRNRSRLLFQLTYVVDGRPQMFLSAIDHVFYSNLSRRKRNAGIGFYPQSITSSIPTLTAPAFAVMLTFLSAIDHVFYSNNVGLSRRCDVWFLSAIDHVFYSNKKLLNVMDNLWFLSAIDHVFYSNKKSKRFNVVTFLSAIDHVFYSNKAACYTSR